MTTFFFGSAVPGGFRKALLFEARIYLAEKKKIPGLE